MEDTNNNIQFFIPPPYHQVYAQPNTVGYGGVAHCTWTGGAKKLYFILLFLIYGKEAKLLQELLNDIKRCFECIWFALNKSKMRRTFCDLKLHQIWHNERCKLLIVFLFSELDLMNFGEIYYSLGKYLLFDL